MSHLNSTPSSRPALSLKPVVEVPPLPQPIVEQGKRPHEATHSHSAARAKKSKAPSKRGVLTGVIAAVLLGGAGVGFLGVLQRSRVPSTPQTQVLSANASGVTSISKTTPSEEKPNTESLNSYTVGPSLPRTIALPSLGALARVVPTGLDDAGNLEMPRNVHDVGWYTSSSRPGEPGAVLVVGYDKGTSVEGAFAGIDGLGSGDTVQLERGDTVAIQYRVVRREVKPASHLDVARLLYSMSPHAPGLTIVAANVDGSRCTVLYAVQK